MPYVRTETGLRLGYGAHCPVSPNLIGHCGHIIPFDRPEPFPASSSRFSHSRIPA